MVKENEITKKEKAFFKRILSKIDNNKKLTKSEIGELSGYALLKNVDEDKGWVSINTTLVEIFGRFFIIKWEEGLEEYVNNHYNNQPIEVFNPKYRSYTSYKTVVFDKNDKTRYAFNGLLNEHMEEDTS